MTEHALPDIMNQCRSQCNILLMILNLQPAISNMPNNDAH
jgi:hypothetical protein